MISTTEEFNRIANGSVRPLNWAIGISFDKVQEPYRGFFVLDESQLDGTDVLATSDTQPLQYWDSFTYERLDDRLISMSVNRSIEFPYNVQSAILDFTLDNTDGYFTFGGDSPIAENILPKRPIRTHLGFKQVGLVPSFVGLTQELPHYSGIDDITMSWSAMDFLSEIANQDLESTVLLRDVRTDEAIAVILEQFGLDSTMYDLDQGNNTIPFVYFTNGTKAGTALRKLVQAENGRLWLSETGIIRFTPRNDGGILQPVATFDESNIVSYKPSRESGVVNHVKITSNVRVVQSRQIIFMANNDDGYRSDADADAYRVPRQGLATFWLSFDNPCWTADTTFVNTTADSTTGFVAVDLSGNQISSGVTVTATRFAESMKIVVTNTNQTAISLKTIRIWGEPAKIVDTFEYDAYEDVSVEKFGEQLLTIDDNDYFGSYANVDAYAEDILTKRVEYSPTKEIVVKGNPALELGDVVTLNYKDVGNYQIVGKKDSLTNKGLVTTLTIERYGEVTNGNN